MIGLRNDLEARKVVMIILVPRREITEQTRSVTEMANSWYAASDMAA